MRIAWDTAAGSCGSVVGVVAPHMLVALLLAALTGCDGGNSAGRSGAASFGLGVADLNGDARPDLVAAIVDNRDAERQGSARVILRDPAAAGGFAAATDYDMGAQTRQVAAGDLNGDGRADLLLSNYADGSLSLRLQSSVLPGKFLARTVIDVLGAPQQAVIEDLNGDGWNDIAVAGNGIALWFNDATEPGNFWFAGSLGPADASRAIASADLDGDRRMDLVVSEGDNAVAVYLQDPAPMPSGSFTSPPLVLEVGERPYDIALGDLNGDGRQDIAAVNWGRIDDVAAATVSVLFQRLVPSARVEFNDASSYPIAGKGTSIVIASLDGDQLPDIAATNELAIGGGVSVLFQRSGTLIGFDPTFEPAVLLPARLAYGLGAADFNGDRLTDLAVTNPDGTLVLYQDQGRPGSFFAPRVVGAEPPAN